MLVILVLLEDRERGLVVLRLKHEERASVRPIRRTLARAVVVPRRATEF